MGGVKEEQEIIRAEVGVGEVGRGRKKPETEDHCPSGALIRRGIYTQEEDSRKATGHRSLSLAQS